MRLTAKQCRIFCLIAALSLALPISLGGVTGLFLWTSPLLFLNMLLSGKGWSWFSLLGAAVLILMIMRHRWYCRWVCPTGVLCDAASIKKRLAFGPRVPRLGGVLAGLTLFAAVMGVSVLGIFDPLAIFHTFFDAFREQSLSLVLIKVAGLLLIVSINFIVPQIWCGRLCPLGGLQDAVTSVKDFLGQKGERIVNFRRGRRMALGALFGIGLSLVFKRVVKAEATRIRPPGALPLEIFQVTCIRCGNCAKACPTAIIQSSFDGSNLIGLLTPYIVFTAGYCLPECTACGDVCPSGAIRPFSRQEKKTLVMGIARIEKQGCWLTEQKECDRCRFYCAYDAITILTSKIDFSAWPVVSPERCVGCGACVLACPARVICVDPIDSK